MQFSITTPQATLVERDASSVTCPGAEGEFGVLPGHMAFMSTLKSGVVTADGEDFCISGGMVEVNPNSVIVLAEDAVAVADINPETTFEQIERLKRRMAEAEGDEVATTRLQKQMSYLELHLAVAKKN